MGVSNIAKAGNTFTIVWTDVLYPQWYMKMLGTPAENGNPVQPGYWLWALLLPLGLMAYFVYHERHGWMARVPIGAMLGLWAGQQVQVWWNRYGAQIGDSLKPIVPNSGQLFVTSATTPESVTVSQAVNNLIATVVLLCVITYFIFSVDFKSKFIQGMSTTGRWALMVGFGAIFGSTVMTRFSLLIDRMYFVWIEWFKGQLLGM